MQRNSLLFFLFNKSINLYRDGWFEVTNPSLFSCLPLDEHLTSECANISLNQIMEAQVFFFFFLGSQWLGRKEHGVNEITKLSTHLKLESPWNITTYHERMEIHNKFCHGKSAVSGIRTGWRRLKRNWTMVASTETC